MLEKDSAMKLGEYKDVLEELSHHTEKLENTIEKEQERWEKEAELVKELMELRKKKFTEDQTPAADGKLDKQISDLTKKIKKIQGEEPLVFAEVTAKTVAEVIESWTGIPVGNMTKDEMSVLLNIEDELRKRVIGQDHAIEQIADVIRGAKVGVRKEEGPIGAFLMVGTSGVGKTELARAVAEALFGDERFMVTLNMTEYQNEYNTSRLIGADPGLVGYGEGGALSEPVRRRPYSVVLLDEIEKANSSVIDLFMQVFDRGMLQDAERRHINFSNTLIFMTSNLASDVLFDLYSNDVKDPEVLLEELRPHLNQHFRPEFLGRVKPIVFLPLATDVMKKIVELKISRLAARLKTNQDLDLKFKPEVLEHITKSCTRAETGARNIDAIIDKTLAPQISRQMLTYLAEEKPPTSLEVSMNDDGGYNYNFS